MTPSSAAGRPDAARQPVGKRGDLRCEPLDIDIDDAGDGDERLLRRYSPRLVILPDIAASAPRPYPTGANDYHPRPAELYLAGIRAVHQVPRGWRGWLNVIYTIAAYLAAIAAGLLILAEVDDPIVPPLIALALGMAVVGSIVAGLYRYEFRTPDDMAALAERTKERDRADDFATTMFRMPGAGSPDLAWSQYGAAVARAGEERVVAGEEHAGEERVVYGRVVRDGELTVLQYWLFFYYNDWWNQHEADWEVAMVYLLADRPLAVACSSHLGGTWRPWPSVERVKDKPDHPTVYVARGSHALYFNTADGVHDAVLHQPWAVFDVRGKLTIHGKEDAVGQALLPGRSYGLRVIPDGVMDITPDSTDWPTWWWLQYRGRWGAKDGILAPSIAEDGLRWDRPAEWVEDHCEADIGSWDDIVAALKAAQPTMVGAIGPAAAMPPTAPAARPAEG